MRPRQATKKQQEAIKYCEKWLYLEFDGNIENFNECSYFLKIYLDEAKQAEMELKREFEAYLWEDLIK